MSGRGLVLLHALAFTLLAGKAVAQPAIELLTGNITGPMAAGGPNARSGWEIGPTLAVPLAWADIGGAELGFRAGLSASVLPTPLFAGGLDVAYHDWPVTDRFKSEFNTRLRNRTFNTLELGGTTWRPRALSASFHAKALAPVRWPIRPWLQLGVGIYRMDPNTKGFQGNSGIFTVDASPLARSTSVGFNGTIGFDIDAGRGRRLGLDLRWERVRCEENFGSDLQVLSLGSHLLFGRF